MYPSRVTVCFVVLLCFSLLGNVYGQANFKEAISNYQDAIVISNTGDTLRGKIDDREWTRNPHSIKFFQEGKEKTFTAKDIAGFLTTGEIYRSAKVDIDVSPLELRHLQISPYPKIIKDTTLFFRVLVNGDVSLLYLNDAVDKKHFFYRKKDGTINELSYYRYYQNDPKENIVTKEIYKGQLKVLALSCDKEQLNNNIAYTHKDLIAFFIQYNKCISVEEVVIEDSYHLKNNVEGFLIGGLNFTQYNLSESILGRSNEVEFSQVLASVGLGINYIFPKSLGKYGLTSTILFNPMNASRSYRIGKSWLITDDFSLNSIHWSAYFRYTLPFSEEVRPYISVGPTLSYMIGPKLTRKKEILDSNGDATLSQDFEFQFSNKIFGASIAVGAAWNRFNIEVRYLRHSTNELSDSNYSQGTLSFSSLSSFLYYRIF